MLSGNVFLLDAIKPAKMLLSRGTVCVYSFNATSVYVSCFLSTESIKKIVDKSSIKFLHGIKLDTKIGKTEDRILVRCRYESVH